MSYSQEDLARMRSVGHVKIKLGNRSVSEYRDKADGHRIKATTDEAGNIVTEHNTPDDRVDVEIRPQAIALKMADPLSEGN